MLPAPPDRPTEEEERVLENRRIDRCLYGPLVKEFAEILKSRFFLDQNFVRGCFHINCSPFYLATRC